MGSSTPTLPSTMRSTARPSVRRAALAVLALLAALARPAGSQIPQQFHNLQVLPKDIGRAELITTMRDWASALGVRCHHCHVGPENLEGMDFATDERETKRAAREMIRMVQSINAGALKALPPRAEPRQQVTCMTCHRTAQRPPLPLVEELILAARARGGSGAAERYQELKRDHYGDGQYDFRWLSLGVAARKLRDEGRLPEAIAVARLGVEQHPDSSPLHAELGDLLARQGDDAAAIEALRKALALDPTAVWIREQLAKLEAAAEPPP